MPNVIFLDFDGVLNNAIEEEHHIDATLNGKYQGFYSPIRVGILNDLIRMTDAKIVLSSTWRMGLSIDEIKTLFREMGIEGEVIGKTEDLRTWGSKTCIFRGNEILKWIIDNEDVVGSQWDFDSYVIIDDDSDMLYWQKENFIHTNAEVGLTEEDAAKAALFLMGTR